MSDEATASPPSRRQTETTVVVTGAGGFIGQTVVALLDRRGVRVRAVDIAWPRHPARGRAMEGAGNVIRVDRDVAEDDVVSLLEGAHAVIHLAGRPGPRSSWGGGFRSHALHNVVATQQVLEAAIRVGARVVLASSSSVYGRLAPDAARMPRPSTPYGVSKLAAEQLVTTYVDAAGLDAVSLRLFSVYGPGQRPDMLVHRAVEAAIRATPLELHGDGSQRRDLTFVTDVAEAFVAAVGPTGIPSGSAIDVGAGRPTSMDAVIRSIEELLGCPIQIRRGPRPAGDPDLTCADVGPAERYLGWRASTTLEQGLTEQISWHLTGLGRAGPGRRPPAAGDGGPRGRTPGS